MAPQLHNLAPLGSLVVVERPDFPFKEKSPDGPLKPEVERLAAGPRMKKDPVGANPDFGEFFDVANAVHRATPLYPKGKIGDGGLIRDEAVCLISASEALRETPDTTLQGIVGVRS